MPNKLIIGPTGTIVGSKKVPAGTYTEDNDPYGLFTGSKIRVPDNSTLTIEEDTNSAHIIMGSSTANSDYVALEDERHLCPCGGGTFGVSGIASVSKVFLNEIICGSCDNKYLSHLIPKNDIGTVENVLYGGRESSFPYYKDSLPARLGNPYEEENDDN